jgi:hypothetical protein
MNDKYVMRIDSPRVKRAEYADQGSNAIIYTSPKSDGYVELEPFGPLKTMKVGGRMQRTVKYTLARRTVADAQTEARKIAGQQ